MWKIVVSVNEEVDPEEAIKALSSVILGGPIGDTGYPKCSNFPGRCRVYASRTQAGIDIFHVEGY